jgi:hypothetical protein
MTNTLTQSTRLATAVAILAMAAVGSAGAAAATSGFPSYGNAQDTVNALLAQGYNVQLNGAAVYPLSGCKVTGVEGTNNSNITSAGALVDRTQETTVYVDISCKGG